MSEPKGTTKTTSHIFPNYLCQHTVSKRGIKKTCWDGGRLAMAAASYSNAMSAAAGGGHRTKRPALHPKVDQSSRVSQVNGKSANQSSTHLVRDSCQSTPLRCSGINESMSFPLSTPTASQPQDKPSVPWLCIHVPAMWMACKHNLLCIRSCCSRKINLKRGLLDDVP